MPTIEDYAQRPRPERLDRIARTPDELADAVRGVADAVLSRRPAPKSWAATEAVCHLRDNEEWFLDRMKLIMAMNEPRFVTTNPDRWAEAQHELTNPAARACCACRR